MLLYGSIMVRKIISLAGQREKKGTTRGPRGAHHASLLFLSRKLGSILDSAINNREREKTRLANNLTRKTNFSGLCGPPIWSLRRIFLCRFAESISRNHNFRIAPSAVFQGRSQRNFCYCRRQEKNRKGHSGSLLQDQEN